MVVFVVRCIRIMGKLLLIMLAFTMFSKTIASSEAARCIEKEREALLSFKQGLVDDGFLLSSWASTNEDCCTWERIGCHNQTNHVILIDLQGESIKGEIGSSLLELKYLKHLDLSWNEFTRIPNFIGSLANLDYLNFAYNPIVGKIPSQLGNLTNLNFLDLSSSIQMIDSLHWLSHLSSLRILRFEGTNFTKAGDWLQSIKLAPSLSRLEVGDCEFPKVDASFLSHINSSNSLRYLSMTLSTIHPTAIPWLLNVSTNLVNLSLPNNHIGGLLPNSFGKMSSLAYIDLSENVIESLIPKSLGNLCNLKVLLLSINFLKGTLDDLLESLNGCTRNSLQILRLTRNQIKGSIPYMETFSSLRELFLDDNQLEDPFPHSLDQIHELVVLHLHSNHLTGQLPDLSKLSFLRELKVDHNKLNGSLPESIGQLSKLELLDISSNSFTGVVSDSHLQKLVKLQELDLSFNSLTLNFTSNRIVPRQLSTIILNSCNLGPRFPGWLRTQSELSHLEISDAGISDVIPDWFYNMTSKLVYLNLSFNHINDTLPDLPMRFGPYPVIDLSSNLLHGMIPVSLSSALSLNLSNNKFTSFESFSSTPTGTRTWYLDISYNMLSGSFPDCWMHWTALLILNLESNNLSGVLSSSLSSLVKIRSLRLRNNNLSGLNPSLQNCTSLLFLDLGNNNLSGKVPAWIGRSLTNLVVLRLKSNMLSGSLPLSLCNLSSLTILDLAHNNISGIIPPCIRNLTSMAQKGHEKSSNVGGLAYAFASANLRTGEIASAKLGSDEIASTNSRSYETMYADAALIMWKGIEYEYKKIPGELKLIDLSSNRLVGHIPKGLTNLVELVQLNFSRNSLNGTIPVKIGKLKQLESLDLSHNQLSGEIPSSLARISALAVLDLSNNQLSGRIPTGTQLQSFNASKYEGNLGLCGPPLTSNCIGDETPKDPSDSDPSGSEDDDEEWFEMLWFYIGIGVGFSFGFWGFFGSLLLKTSWRRAYFGFLNFLGDWLYVTVCIKWNKLKRRLQS